MRKLWLLFAQTCTVCLAVLFIVATLRPEWLPRRGSSMLPTILTQQVSQSPDRAAAIASYSDAARRAMPSVVNIYTSKEVRVPNMPFGNDPFFRELFGDRFGSRREQTASLGSGVIVSPQGYILTNNHVVEAADEIEVAFADGRRAIAKTIGADPETDLAVVQVQIPNLPAITFSKGESLRVGDVVLAIGNPFGVGQTVTLGIVSALGRSQLGINTFENFIQTDAAINPGNSGGALIDTQGNLVGVNSAIYSRSGGSLGIGFAIPVSTAQQVMESLIKTGTVTRGYIGVEPQDITPELADAFHLPRKDGVLIAGVVSGGAADKAGVRVGDILVSINQKPVPDTPAMLSQIAQLAPESKVQLSVLRQGKEMQIDVTVGTRPKPRASQPQQR